MKTLKEVFHYFESSMRDVSYVGFWLVLVERVDKKFSEMKGEVVKVVKNDDPEKYMQDLLKEVALKQQELVKASPELEIFGVLGSTIGVIEGGLPWVGKAEKSPYVDGLSKIIASYSDKIPDALRTPLASLAKYDGEKMTSENAPEIKKLVEQIKSKI